MKKRIGNLDVAEMRKVAEREGFETLTYGAYSWETRKGRGHEAFGERPCKRGEEKWVRYVKANPGAVGVAEIYKTPKGEMFLRFTKHETYCEGQTSLAIFERTK